MLFLKALLRLYARDALLLAAIPEYLSKMLKQTGRLEIIT